MSSGEGRAPFECVCGFTAGTSFAWEKHLGLRNTPYSTVRHTRVTRETKDAHGRDVGVAEIGSSGRPQIETRLNYPTPKGEKKAHPSCLTPRALPLIEENDFPCSLPRKPFHPLPRATHVSSSTH